MLIRNWSILNNLLEIDPAVAKTRSLQELGIGRSQTNVGGSLTNVPPPVADETWKLPVAY